MELSQTATNDWGEDVGMNEELEEWINAVEAKEKLWQRLKAEKENLGRRLAAVNEEISSFGGYMVNGTTGLVAQEVSLITVGVQHTSEEEEPQPMDTNDQELGNYEMLNVSVRPVFQQLDLAEVGSDIFSSHEENDDHHHHQQQQYVMQLEPALFSQGNSAEDVDGLFSISLQELQDIVDHV